MLRGPANGPKACGAPTAARTFGWRARLVMLIPLAIAAGPLWADDDVVTYVDPPHDWLVRPTDPNGSLPLDLTAHSPVDLLSLKLGRWEPFDPYVDLFAGEYSDDGLFFRLDVVLAGLHNPPGSTDPQHFDPFAYGNHPVYGFVEVDVDNNVDTGGELDAPQFRFLGNAARFGGLPDIPELVDRFALDGSAFDHDFLTPPFIERSGEEFHLALLGSEFGPTGIDELVGNGNQTFEPNEVWVISGTWFHRAHGFEEYSFMSGGGRPGEYDPVCKLRWAHNPYTDTTELTLVYPLVNEGAARMWGQETEEPDEDASNQFSIHEALVDLNLSASWWAQFEDRPPEELLLHGWANETPEQFLDPIHWRVQALLGISYNAAAPTGNEYFVWTDIFPNPVRGDVNGDGQTTDDDRALIESFIRANDPNDVEFVIPGFPENFTVFDVNQNGICDALDPLLTRRTGDLDGDGHVDLNDLADFQLWFSGAGHPFAPSCGLADLDTDGDVDGEDWARFEGCLTGPND